MNQGPENDSRRRFLTITTSVVGGLGVVAAAIPFIQSWTPSERTKAAGAPVKIDISKVEEGQLILVEWQGKPVWVVKRSKEALAQLVTLNPKMKDPDSKEPQQPDYATNQYRSIKPELFIAVGICTHLGCSPTYLPDSFSSHEAGVTSGFFCPCHGSVFDMAGRVFSGNSPAPLNLVVPRYSYIDDNTIIIGTDSVATKTKEA